MNRLDSMFKPLNTNSVNNPSNFSTTMGSNSSSIFSPPDTKISTQKPVISQVNTSIVATQSHNCQTFNLHCELCKFHCKFIVSKFVSLSFFKPNRTVINETNLKNNKLHYFLYNNKLVFSISCNCQLESTSSESFKQYRFYPAV